MIDFNSKNEGTWFYFDEENPDLGGVCLRLPTSAEYEEIRGITVHAGKPDYHRGVRYETEKINQKLQTKLSLRKFIVGWKDVSLDGEELECNNDTKEKMIKIQDFQLFIGDCIEKLVEGNKTIEAARLKNFESSVDGDSESGGVSAERNA